jgi:hypothetical protein
MARLVSYGRELRKRGYESGYTAMAEIPCGTRPVSSAAFEVRLETPGGDQAHRALIDFARYYGFQPKICRSGQTNC